jgi:ribosomal protein S18 acetylase RimI-like enzyme
MMPLIMRSATEADIPALAAMNKRLIEDEDSRNPMSVAELQQRMHGWLIGDWQVRVFEEENNGVVGYAIFQSRPDEYFAENQIVYLRQLYVAPEYRSRGVSQQAVQLLREGEFPEGCTVVIDVLATNPRGQHFWSKVGFESYCTTMRLTMNGKQAGRQEGDH